MPLNITLVQALCFRPFSCKETFAALRKGTAVGAHSQNCLHEMTILGIDALSDITQSQDELSKMEP